MKPLNLSWFSILLNEVKKYIPEAHFIRYTFLLGRKKKEKKLWTTATSRILLITVRIFYKLLRFYFTLYI